MKHIRDYEHVAQMEHFCNVCKEHIGSGEQYIGSVYIDKGRAVVSKQHSNPSCDFPEDPDDEDYSDSELEREVDNFVDDFKEAA